MNQSTRLLKFVAVIVLCWMAASGNSFSADLFPSATDIAIVANHDVAVNNLTLSEIRNIFMGNRQFWSQGLRITLLVRAPVARERDIVLKQIYRMTEGEFRQYWIGKVFRAEAVSGPKIVYSNETTIDLVEKVPGCIAFIDASQIPKNVKVIKIDDRLPGNPGYPLH